MLISQSENPAPTAIGNGALNIVRTGKRDGQSSSFTKAQKQESFFPRPTIRRTCRECGNYFEARRVAADFCSTKCRCRFHNRATARGADLFHLFMAARFDRAEAEQAGVWSLMCRMAAAYKSEDDRDRGGRKSWDDIEKVKARNSDLGATLVDNNIAGVRRKGGCR